MKLFLSGGGSGIASFEIDKKYLEAVDLSKPILYIPIAIDTNEHPYPACFEWFKGNFAHFKFDNFVMWTEEGLKGKTIKDFEQFGGIYIGGGNTFKLLKDLRDFGMVEIINELIARDVPVYGGSAGAIIFGRTIILAMTADKNDVGLKDLNAFNMLDGVDLWCHYKPSEESDVFRYMKEYDLKKVIAIPENTGLYVTESSVEAVGPGDIKFFEAGTVKKLI